MKKRNMRTPQQKADILNAFDRLPEKGSGERGAFCQKHSLNWRMMQGWRHDRRVRQLMSGTFTPGEPIKITDDIPKFVEDGKKRVFTLKQKAWLVAQYDAMPQGTDRRGEFMKEFHLHWNMLNRWRAELQREGIPLPNPKLSMNGDAPPEHHVGRPPGSKNKQPRTTKSLLNKLSGEQVLQLVEERQRIHNEAYAKFVQDLKESLK